MKAFYHKEDGMVLGAAIDKYVYVIVKERFDEKIYINYSKKEIINSVPEIKHELVREAMKKTGIEKGVEITTLADVPSEGCGLGSSSSTTVGILNALYNFKGIQVPLEQLAAEACKIEIDICKKPIGKQDQYIAAIGGLNKITFHPDESVSVSRLPVSNNDVRKIGSNILLFATNNARKADDILKKQKEITEGKRDVLGRMKNFVRNLEESFLNDRLDDLGNLLHENWLLKKSLVNDISTPEIDDLYERALNAGALGGKICGAGGGGFLLLYVPRDKQDALRKALKDYRELPFMLDPFGSRIIFNFRTYPSK